MSPRRPPRLPGRLIVSPHVMFVLAQYPLLLIVFELDLLFDRSLILARVLFVHSIQYGGSVKPGSAAELSSQPDVDGFLVGAPDRSLSYNARATYPIFQTRMAEVYLQKLRVHLLQITCTCTRIPHHSLVGYRCYCTASLLDKIVHAMNCV